MNRVSELPINGRSDPAVKLVGLLMIILALLSFSYEEYIDPERFKKGDFPRFKLERVIGDWGLIFLGLLLIWLGPWECH
jgi:hypothetical protein